MRHASRFLPVVAAAVLIALLGGAGPGLAQRQSVTLRMVLVAPEDRWNILLDLAKAKFAKDNPNIDLKIEAQILPFGDRLTRLRAAATGRTPLDIVSLDQPEVGDFAAAGFTTDLTDRINRDLNGLADWLPAYRAATQFGGRWHAIWAWTDARVLWYWKDLVREVGVDPRTDMRTWDGYLDGCRKLTLALARRGIQGCLLIGQPWIADWTFPYVWMSGGDLGVDVNANLTRTRGAAEAWLPMLDSRAWISALRFTRKQVNAGIRPFTEHQFGVEFRERKFAVSLEGTWLLGGLKSDGADLRNIGMIGAFPAPERGTPTATMAGGWTLAIPATSQQKDAAWGFLRAMVDDVATLGRVQAQYGYLPTRRSFANRLAGDFKRFWNEGGEDRWGELQQLAPHAYGRPNFASWPKVAAAITDMVQQVMFKDADPQAVSAAAQRTVLVEVLRWPAGTRVELVDDAGGGCARTDVDRLIPSITPVQRAADRNGNGQICSRVVLP